MGRTPVVVLEAVRKSDWGGSLPGGGGHLTIYLEAPLAQLTHCSTSEYVFLKDVLKNIVGELQSPLSSHPSVSPVSRLGATPEDRPHKSQTSPTHRPLRVGSAAVPSG